MTGRSHQSIEQRFWPKVKRLGPDECWPWTAYIGSHGYGSFEFLGRMTTAHRVSWHIHKGPVPAGLCVLHRCDNRPCVNPAHLFLGTKADNNRDMAQKERARGPSFKGEGHPRSLLNDDAVRLIRSLAPNNTHGEIAKRVGIDRSVVGKIIRKKAWVHVE